MEQHKSWYIEGFTKKYHVHMLVYYEVFEQFTEALIREKVLKWITRKRKMELIENANPLWKDLSTTLSS